MRNTNKEMALIYKCIAFKYVCGFGESLKRTKTRIVCRGVLVAKKRSLTRSLIVLLLTVLVLYLLFLPKYAGYEHYEAYYTPGTVLQEESCTCFGVLKTDLSNRSFEAKELRCYGIPTNCKMVCYGYLGKMKMDTKCP